MAEHSGPSLAPSIDPSAASIASPAEVLHRVAHAGGSCPSPNMPGFCPWLADAEQIIQDLADAGYCVVPLVGLTQGADHV